MHQFEFNDPVQYIGIQISRKNVILVFLNE